MLIIEVQDIHQCIVCSIVVTFIEMCRYIIFGCVIAYAYEMFSKFEFDFPICLSYLLSFACLPFNVVYEIGALTYDIVWCFLPVVFELIPLNIFILGQCLQLLRLHFLDCIFVSCVGFLFPFVSMFPSVSGW